MRIADELQTKYWQVPEVSDLKDMIYRSAEKYGKKTAFEIKNQADEIVKIDYQTFKEDVVALRNQFIKYGTSRKNNWSCRQKQLLLDCFLSCRLYCWYRCAN